MVPMSAQDTPQDNKDTAETTHEKRWLHIYHPNITFIPRPNLPEREQTEDDQS